MVELVDSKKSNIKCYDIAFFCVIISSMRWFYEEENFRDIIVDNHITGFIIFPHGANITNKHVALIYFVENYFFDIHDEFLPPNILVSLLYHE